MATVTDVKVGLNQQAISAVRQNLYRGVLSLAKSIQQGAVSRAPIDTGALRGSIKIRPTQPANSIYIIAGGKSDKGGVVRYARIHELGGWAGQGHNTYITAKHYMSNACDNAVRGNLKRHFGEVTK